MVTLVEFATREEAEAFAAKYDAALGYPAVGAGVCTAVQVGGGIHATHPKCCTLRHADVREGKTAFAVPVDDAVRALSGEVETSLAAKMEIAVEAFAPKSDPIASTK